MKQTKETDSKRTTVSFRPETYRTIEEIAKQKKVTASWVIRDAAEKYVAEKEPDSFTDQNIPVKVNDLKTLSSPAVEIPATSGIDEIDLGKDPYAEVDSVYVQLLDILNRFEYSEDPEVYTLYIKNMIPISNDITDDSINKIKLFATVTEIDEFFDMIKFINNEETNYSFICYMSNIITATVVIALNYRYTLDYHCFPYLTKYDDCCKQLKDEGIKEDIDNVLLYKIRKLFSNPSVECLKVKNDSKIVSKLGMITTIVETGILV